MLSKAYSAQLVAAIAELLGQLCSGKPQGQQRIYRGGGVEDVAVGVPLQIGDMHRQVETFVLTVLKQHDRPGIKAGQLPQIAVVGLFRKDHHRMAVVQGGQAFGKGGAEAGVAVGGDEIDALVVQIGQGCCDKAEKAGEMEIPVLLLMVIDVCLVLIGGFEAFVHLVRPPETQRDLAVKLQGQRGSRALVIAQNDPAGAHFFPQINEFGFFDK